MKNITIGKIISECSKRIPNAIAFSFPEINKKYTYKEFNDEVNAFAKGLIDKNIHKGDNVGIWMSNIKEWFIAFFAIQKIGACAVPINTSFKKEEMEYILNKFDIKCLIMSNGYKNNYEDIINNIFDSLIISVGFKNKKTVSFEDIYTYGKNVPDECLNIIENYINYQDAAIILPTSGTTGFPKGAVLNHGALIKNGFDIGERLKLNSHDNMLIQVPMFHCFGITLSMLSSITHTSTITVVSRFKADVVLNVIEKEKITCLNGVPTMFERLINNPNFNNTDIDSLTKGIMAGSNCLPDFIEKTKQTMNMDIVSVYGLTEASPGLTMSSLDDSAYIKKYTVGSVLPDVDVKIINPDTGLECNYGEEGEVVSKGYNTMVGYYNMEEETNKVIDQNGYLHTGDLAYKDKNNCFVITGRIKDIIIRGGENISPKEIEVIINKCPGVSSSAVFGVDDEIYGQVVMACVIPDEDDISEETIKKFMSDKCASYKIPTKIDIVSKFPTNAAGKVLVYKLREKYSQ